ncbi:hypothetical protein EDB81DRAFT_915983 [Dactylonectria macrodidyma]|uniref:G-protein coupled receptors family 2 profile 2 domain-containing protein n=1 Tax=Dactylonectria macrodidyma TaxID=307937 RepID=A0A9P9DE46_9HYPO|nr:hypothetical protein EDB81DRAFT_915983 [Dactylonectria macrodidyma]
MTVPAVSSGPSPSQLETLELLERIGGSASLVSVMIIFVTYGLIARARNPRNTFIVFASIANVGASIGCIISQDGLHAGEDSILCRAQSFLVHIFMQSDAWWSFGMSFNTFLVVSGRTDPDTFNKWMYSLICFGGPFITGFTLFFIYDPVRGPVYGATLVWCWIREDWASIRLFTSYIFVWICIIGSLILNTIVGYRIFYIRNQIRSFSNSLSLSAIDNQLPLTNTRSNTQGSEHPIINTQDSTTHAPTSDTTKPMSIVVGSTLRTPDTSLRSPKSRHSLAVTSHSGSDNVPKTPRIANATKGVISRFRLQDPVKRAYLRTTFMFTISVLVTWVPASINRIRSLTGGTVPFSNQVVMAAVMPLQGLWNAAIFFATSHSILREVAREKWGLWVLKSTTIDEEVAERAVVGQAHMDEDPDRTDSGSDIELRHVSRIPVKGN